MAVGACAVFLDKDGTLVEDVPYNADPSRVQFAPGSGLAARLLASAGYRLFLVSNQAGVAHGYFRQDALSDIEDVIRARLQAAGASLQGVYFCPHHPNARLPEYAVECDCRKPAPGMILRAARDHDIVLAGSWMIGDILDDVEAGRRAGCRTVLIDNGGETEWRMSRLRRPDYVARDLGDAAKFILSETANVMGQGGGW